MSKVSRIVDVLETDTISGFLCFHIQSEARCDYADARRSYSNSIHENSILTNHSNWDLPGHPSCYSSGYSAGLVFACSLE